MPKSDTQWKPGQSGNPAGRPKGSRDKFNEAFLKALQEEWDKRGAQALADLTPAELAKIGVSVLSKESRVDVEHSGAVAHEHQGLSETARWLEGISGSRPEPLPN